MVWPCLGVSLEIHNPTMRLRCLVALGLITTPCRAFSIRAREEATARWPLALKASLASSSTTSKQLDWITAGLHREASRESRGNAVVIGPEHVLIYDTTLRGRYSV